MSTTKTTVKKAVAKAVEVKAPAMDIKESAKAPVTEAKEIKAEVKAPVEEVKAPAKKATAKTSVKKTTAKADEKTAKKTTAKKTTVKKAAKAAEVKIAIQYADKNYTADDLAKIANDVWVYDYGKDAAELKDVQLYVKPEESKVYYVFNNEIAGDFII